MKLLNRCVVPAGRTQVWDYLMDIPVAARCVPGVTEVAEHGGGRFQGKLKARVGPMSMTLSGTVIVEQQEQEQASARFLVEASDRRVGGGVRTVMLMRLSDAENGGTEVAIETDTTFIGKLGEIGQPVIRRKAQQTIEEFARNLTTALATRSPSN